jgi:hypothetical protein
VWYVSYGSNLCVDRFACYLTGGRPPGAARAHPGCADPTPPRRTLPIWLPGGIYFALTSTLWGGGMAFYDPAVPQGAAARAYLISTEQFADVMAQEMHRPAGARFDLAAALAAGRLQLGPSRYETARAAGRLQLGPGRYETVLCVGERDGHPLLTFTAPWSAAEVPHNPPSPAYVAMLAAGLREAHGWPESRVAEYLADRIPPAG